MAKVTSPTRSTYTLQYVNSSEFVSDEHPFMIGIGVKSVTQFTCGGALISAKGKQCQSKQKDFGPTIITMYFLL
jgi:hypothetical protein